MKKMFFALLLIVVLASCGTADKSKTIDCQILQVTTSYDPDSSANYPVFRAIIEVNTMGSIKHRENVYIAGDVAMGFVQAMYTHEPHYFVRLSKRDDNTYGLKEVAMLNYDHGTPAQYEIPSDKKVIGIYDR